MTFDTIAQLKSKCKGGFRFCLVFGVKSAVFSVFQGKLSVFGIVNTVEFRTSVSNQASLAGFRQRPGMILPGFVSTRALPCRSVSTPGHYPAGVLSARGSIHPQRTGIN